MDDEIDYSDFRAYQETGQWPGGQVPDWALALATQTGTRVGSAAFDSIVLERRLAALEEALKPFAEYGGQLPAHAKAAGTAASLRLSSGSLLKVPNAAFLRAARLLGLTAASGGVTIAVHAHSYDRLRPGERLWGLRILSRARPTQWLLVHEHDGMADLLDYAGEVRGTVPCQAEPAEQRIGVPIDAIRSEPRRQAVLELRGLDRTIPKGRKASTQRSLQEAFDRKLGGLLREIRLQRKWTLAGHWQSPDGARLVALALEGDGAGRVVVAFVDTDGAGWLLSRWGIHRADYPGDRLPGEGVSRLLAGVVSKSDRLVTDAMSGLVEDPFDALQNPDALEGIRQRLLGVAQDMGSK